MRQTQDVLEGTLKAGTPIYGLTHGFGPLVGHSASSDRREQGLGLVSHLGTSQGRALSPEVCQTVVALRLQGLRLGYSGVSPEFWEKLSKAHCRGFVPVIQREGTVSASGDLQPLAQAARAFAGDGSAWGKEHDGTWCPKPAQSLLAALDLEPIVWSAREALAFVNGTSVGLAAALNNHVRIRRFARATAFVTGRLVALLKTNPQAYAEELALARGHVGHQDAARWIREDGGTWSLGADRPLQEPYSLRCAPQVVGAALDGLRQNGTTLATEALGCTDNPVIAGARVLHGGNFHGLPVAFVSDAHGLILQQLTFLAERQIQVILSPHTNGGYPPMLTPEPGPSSGLAGLQISATAFVARIRQMVYPCTLTSLPTNLDNQDHVPMALNGANAVSDALELGWLVLGSLARCIIQRAQLDNTRTSHDDWTELEEVFPLVVKDRPLAEEVRQAARRLESIAERRLAKASEC